MRFKFSVSQRPAFPGSMPGEMDYAEVGADVHRSGFSTIEMAIVLAVIGVIVLIGFPKIRETLDKTNVRSARTAVATLVATARQAAIQRGCVSAVHFASTNATVWVTTSCPSKVDTVSGVEQLATRFNVSLVATRDSLRFDPRGLGMDNLSSTNTVIRLSGSVSSAVDSVVVSPMGKVVH
jgi:prepilin-type N-terminal cleavage/methylation domain-containing protein